MATGLNIDQFNNGINAMLRDIADNVPNIVQVIAVDAKALVRNRIQEKGLNAEEQELAGYSPAYKKRKQKAGKDVGFTNLTFSGDMFRKIDIVEAGQRGSEYVVTIGGKDKLSEDKVEWNSERYGDIMDVSDEEEKLLAQSVDDQIQNIINQSGFGQ